MTGSDRRGLFMPVLGGVVFAGLFGVMRGVVQMAFGHVSVMAGLLVVSRFMMFRCGVVMLRGVLVMFRCFTVVLRGIFRHVQLSLEIWPPGFPSGLATSLTANCDAAIHAS
jgi:hypothetical protein